MQIRDLGKAAGVSNHFVFTTDRARHSVCRLTSSSSATCTLLYSPDCSSARAFFRSASSSTLGLPPTCPRRRAALRPAFTRCRKIPLSNSAYCGEPQYAEFEREILRERTRAGLVQARLSGKRLGRPITAGLHAAEVRKLYRAGVAKAEIARRLEIGRTSVRRILG